MKKQSQNINFLLEINETLSFNFNLEEAAALELGVEADYLLWEFFDNDIQMLTEYMLGITYGATSFITAELNDVFLHIVLRGPFIRMKQDDYYDGSFNVAQNRVSQYWSAKNYYHKITLIVRSRPFELMDDFFNVMQTFIMKYIAAFIFSMLSFLLISQKHDYNWLFGYDGDADDDRFGITQINFNPNPVSIERKDSAFMKIDLSNTSISDSLGNLLFYTNGCYIADKTHQMMENGDGLNPGAVHDANCDIVGYTASIQSCLTLPHPNEPNLYYLFHKPIDYHSQLGLITNKLYYTLIDMEGNNGLGEVIEKNIPIILDTLTYGEITAVKHANGNDWWLVSPQFSNNRYYFWLLNSNGIQESIEQIIGDTITSGSGISAFSPDGTKYIRYTPEEQVHIFDFDRSTGLLSNPQHIPFDDPPPSFSGISVSPNSRFLYLSNTNWLLQFDLEAADIAESMVVIDTFDGFQSPFATQFFLAQLGPDCKIYISSFSGANVLHVINHPDRKGVACDFQQHAIDLPTYHGGSMPHFPNYRLGTTPSYPCDSTIVLTGVKYVTAPPLGLLIYPNPAYEVLTIQLPSFVGQKRLEIYNAFGQRVITQIISSNKMELNVANLPSGVYICSVLEDGVWAYQQKFMIVK